MMCVFYIISIALLDNNSCSITPLVAMPLQEGIL